MRSTEQGFVTSILYSLVLELSLNQSFLMAMTLLREII